MDKNDFRNELGDKFNRLNSKEKRQVMNVICFLVWRHHVPQNDVTPLQIISGAIAYYNFRFMRFLGKA